MSKGFHAKVRCIDFFEQLRKCCFRTLEISKVQMVKRQFDKAFVGGIGKIPPAKIN
jgi:hypothetical protein